MKGSFSSRGRGRQTGKQLHKLGLAVREFVEASVPAGSEKNGSSGCVQGLPKQRPRGKRRELRREKRKWKRKQRRWLLNGGKVEEKEKKAVMEVKRPPPSLPPSSGKKEKEKKPRKEVLPTGKASLEARKKALLAANEAEEREIRRLERQLGLGKRRKKRRQKGLEEAQAAALPRSFALDGLGYVLGAFGPGDAFSGLYESSTEEEEEERKGGMAKPEGEGSEEEEEEDGDDDVEKEEEEEDLSMEGEASDDDDDDDDGDLEKEGLSMEGEASDDDDGDLEKEDLSMEGEASDDEDDMEKEDLNMEGEASEESSMEEEEEKECEDDGDAANELQSSRGRTLESPQDGESLTQSATKYVPPQMRRSEETLDAKKMEELERLKKSLKGLINRLSEPNLASISGQLEELYMANSRKDMNEALTDILISACVTAAIMPSRLVMEHVLLISILHRTVGIEVGAHFLETVVRKFDEVYKSGTEGKECENLLTLIAHLYNFHVVHSLLIFDILKKLVSTFSEKDIELMLLLLKNVGFSLRKDDALALKELITEAQKKANAVGKQFQDQSRVRFMLEIMLALKNNDMRKIPGYDPEPVERLRKLQRTLIHSSSGKEAQLRVSLESLLSADQVGRWWIVGSSWSGAPMIDSTTDKVQQVLPVGKVSSKILDLARKQRMNTDIRRNIFCILMTSEDFLDAFEKLLKLRLKDQQEREIVHVLIDCCLQEKTYNPFYAYLSAKFCEYERRFQMTFQFSIWDKIRDLENLSPTTSSNLVNLLAHLLKTKSLSLTVFKVIEFSELDKPKVHFLRQVLSVLLLKTDPEDLNHIFGKLADNPKLGMLQEGLKLFLTHFLLKSVQSHRSAEEATLLRERIELVSKTLKAKESRVKL